MRPQGPTSPCCFCPESESFLASTSSSTPLPRAPSSSPPLSSEKRLSPLLVLVLLFRPSRKVFLLRASEEEGLDVILSLLSSLLLFSEALLGLLLSSSSPLKV